ncbi:Ubiquitin-like domain-containing CTD phosphatase [Zea mays]|uniref:Ubiquitin-like domain-containing CTD phosphatase n=1 Tax=Zea mays TaxID=4577 RepID=A0A1D6N5U1_MAIZE|nr:Ubiquitin-like domain-containing CTD phosphatase [Zea mays]
MKLMRPYLHQFLKAAYSKYDIMIRSATSLKIEVETRFFTASLLVSFGLSSLSSLYYNEKNTIMFDDLRRNFVMNPQNGLVIKPFRKRHNDHELVKLAHYLLSIGDLEDLSKLDHGKQYVPETRKGNYIRMKLKRGTPNGGMQMFTQKAHTITLYP